LVGLGLASWQVGKRQSFFASAWDCQLYSYQVAPDGIVTAANHSSRRPGQKAQVNINNSPVTILSVPSLDQGQTATIGKIIPPLGGIISWQVIGTAGCSSAGSYTPTPAVSNPYTPVLLIPTLIPDKPTPTF
jgi:hypothetical protein